MKKVKKQKKQSSVTLAEKSESSLKILSSDRIFICGMTGSGKSKLMKTLARKLHHVVIVDYKHEIKIVGFSVVKNYAGFLLVAKRRKFVKVIFRPVGTVEEQDRELSKLEKYIFEKGRHFIFYDDLRIREKQLMKPPQTLDDIIRMGRSRLVGLGVSHQRPSMLSQTFISEAQHLFVFKLALEVDRKKIEGVIGSDNAELLEKVSYEDHEFLYYNTRTRTAIISKL